jgi:hypothetical protein
VAIVAALLGDAASVKVNTVAEWHVTSPPGRVSATGAVRVPVHVASTTTWPPSEVMPRTVRASGVTAPRALAGPASTRSSGRVSPMGLRRFGSSARTMTSARKAAAASASPVSTARRSPVTTALWAPFAMRVSLPACTPG